MDDSFLWLVFAVAAVIAVAGLTRSKKRPATPPTEAKFPAFLDPASPEFDAARADEVARGLQATGGR